MDDKKQMTDAELQKLLQDIDVPAPDEAAKISAMNVAESQFAEKVKKNEKTRQGNAAGFRPMDVLHNTFIFLTGGKNMKKAYVISGTLGLALLAVVGSSVFVGQDLAPRQKTFHRASSAMSSPGGSSLTSDAKAVIQSIMPSPKREMASLEMEEQRLDASQRPATKPAAALPIAAQNYAGISADAVAPQHRMIAPMPPAPEIAPYVEQNRDRFEGKETNPVKSVQSEPVSTLSIDVDTASYAVVRRSLNHGQLPQRDAVRVEELINYFDYDYPLPESREEPFQPSVALYETPWNAETMLMHVGIKGHDIPADAQKPRSNMVFLIDTSGSMRSQDKLPLLQQAFRMLVNTMDENDTISIVTYAGNAGVVLEPTSVDEKDKILNAIDNLNAGGSTAGAAGIKTAYDLAQQHFDEDGVNRVILATDGDFNVGMTDHEQLKQYIEQKRDSGIYLSVMGFGQGNYNDALMQTLAQNGNGNAAYIDSINEARKVLVDEASSTLYPIANDVKIQVEFNPTKVAEYRLIGYETRMLKREDFNNDKVDAGDIGAGHTVTAIYELTPVGSKAQMIDDLRYGNAHEDAQEEKVTAAENSNEYAFLKMRYKLPGESTSKLITRPITTADTKTVDGLSDDMRFAAAVAAFGQKLRGEQYIGDFTYNDILELANSARGVDPFNYRGEFINLVRNAEVASQR
jgi:Ca-activated chloride channel homolog